MALTNVSSVHDYLSITVRQLPSIHLDVILSQAESMAFRVATRASRGLKNFALSPVVGPVASAGRRIHSSSSFRGE